jgi:hypothetical protein
MRKRKLVVGGMGVALAAVTAILVQHSSSGDPSASPSVVVADADTSIPTATMQDMATYADHLVAATVTAEDALPASDEEIKAGEGYIPRVLTFRIDKVLWSRAGAAAAPSSFQNDLDGWQFEGENKTPIRFAGEPMIEVGKTYVLPITKFTLTADMKGDGWGVFSADAITPYTDGQLGTGDTIISAESNIATREGLVGDPSAALVSALASTAPDPDAKDFMTLPPEARYQKAAAVHEAAGDNS